jgi:ubiquinone/menaquinone biosynthesis C-methylase UbiE
MNPSMGRLETFVVNSPFREPFARREVRRFRRMASIGSGVRILEVGCGAGLTTRAIVDILRPAALSAFDFDAGQVRRAAERLASVPGVEIRQADATAMPYADAAFDAVIAIGILHHNPRWRAALPEVGRVLRPGGVFCFAEPTKGRLRNGLYRLFPHPVEAMFEKGELLQALTGAGLDPDRVTQSLLWNVFGVAIRREARIERDRSAPESNTAD